MQYIDMWLPVVLFLSNFSSPKGHTDLSCPGDWCFLDSLIKPSAFNIADDVQHLSCFFTYRFHVTKLPSENTWTVLNIFQIKSPPKVI